MRKFTLLILMFVLSCISTMAYDFMVDTIAYQIIDSAKNEVAVTNSKAWASYNVGTLTIPAFVEHEGKTYTVVEIAKEAFYYSEKLDSVSLPETLRKIGEGAFESCSGLKSIVIPNSVTEIGNHAFDACI